MGAATPVRGCAYTLDDEGVVQIVMSPNPLAKGTKSSVVFCTELQAEHFMGKNILEDDLRFVVHKNSDDEEVAVSEIYNGEYRTVPNVMVIPTKARRFTLGCGLLESPILENKKVLFLGCGSMGADMVSQMDQPVVHYGQRLTGMETWPLVTIVLVCMVIAVVAIFLFKRRTLQVRLTAFGFILSVVYAFLLFFWADLMARTAAEAPAAKARTVTST